MVIGALLGLGAATCHSVSYLFSRLFVIRRRKGILRLLVLGHVLMGAASAIALPALWSADVPPLSRYILPLLGAAGFYLLGQAGLFLALRHADASRVSPLLGLKVIVLAAITVLFLRDRLSLLQWVAVALSGGAAVLLGSSGTRLNRQAVVGLIFACLSYCLSDLSIKALVEALSGLGPWRAVLLAVSMSYVLCGILGLLLMPWAGRAALKDLPYALPFAVSWLLAMVFLYACFAAIGVVFGNIMQSTRGLISILFGAALAHAGMVHLEEKTSRAVLARRLAAAGLMCLAIAMFFLARKAS